MKNRLELLRGAGGSIRAMILSRRRMGRQSRIHDQFHHLRTAGFMWTTGLSMCGAHLFSCVQFKVERGTDLF